VAAFETWDAAGRTFDAIVAGQTWHWDLRYSRDEWLDQMLTSGEASQLSATTLNDLIEGSGGVIDAAGGAFSMHFTTVAIVAPRLSTSDHMA
jgi:hypothetical protein